MTDNVVERVRDRGEKLAENSFAKDVISRLSQMSRSELDDLNFGVIKVNDQGVVEIYNRYESDFAGVSQLEAEGKNFFTQVAPCTNNNVFYGTFQFGVRQKKMNYLFHYTFTYKMKPTIVIVHLYRDPDTQNNYVLIQKR